ncbi:uncharacterized protein LOC143428397 [Xylocopa sonorina]|uniref:uncharacterized protein LOC143428397 n=1 Tax=Xylocopa sonorina TaxID=1818115 RepID=UPI00403AA3A1
MPQIMVEAFARNLIGKIMLEAFDVIDTNDQKLQMVDDRSQSAGVESDDTRTAQEIQDRLCTDCSEPDTTELIEKMVHGLNNLQIGDSTSVSSELSKLEKQVKHVIHVIHSIDSVSLVDASEHAETRATQGQGDVQQITHNAVIETTTDPTCALLEKQTDSSNEATKVSVGLLYRMIEELEPKTEDTDQKEANEPEPIVKEKLATWEETEEQFIRTIESIDDSDQSKVDSPAKTNLRNDECDFASNEATSSFVVHPTSFARNISLEEVTIEEITSSPHPDQTHDSSSAVRSGKLKKKHCDESRSSQERKKKGILSRTRKLLRTIFGRRKK